MRSSTDSSPSPASSADAAGAGAGRAPLPRCCACSEHAWSKSLARHSSQAGSPRVGVGSNHCSTGWAECAGHGRMHVMTSAVAQVPRTFRHTCTSVSSRSNSWNSSSLRASCLLSSGHEGTTFCARLRRSSSCASSKAVGAGNAHVALPCPALATPPPAAPQACAVAPPSWSADQTARRRSPRSPSQSWRAESCSCARMTRHGCSRRRRRIAATSSRWGPLSRT